MSYAQPGERGRRVLIYQKQHDLGGKVLGITVATWVIYYFLNNIIPSNGGMETTSVCEPSFMVGACDPLIFT